MSRSHRRTPVHGITAARSEKEDKRIYNRKYRSGIKRAIARAIDPLPTLREYSNVWDMAKDGKYWFNPEKYPKLMRK